LGRCLLDGDTTVSSDWLAGSKPSTVFKLATTGYNFAFAFSCWHTIVINTTLLPKPLRPSWAIRIGMGFGSVYFSFLGVMAVRELLRSM
jgi:hypothetical protein